jgi:monooxygenase
MLQRSPTYIVSLPGQDKISDWLRQRLGPKTAYSLTRWKNVLFGMGFYAYCRRFPEQAKKYLVKQVDRHLGKKVDVKTHFTPRYNPWDQRLCLVPDADLFEAIGNGSASVVTDRIESFTEKGIKLESGQELEADLIVTATGLKLKALGGIAFDVDGKRMQAKDTMVYKGMMCSDVPNMAFAIGYTNASWTLKCDLTSEYVCRVLNHMDEIGATICCPRKTDPSVTEEPLIDFSSGYVQRSIELFPRQGSVPPWKLHQNYALDLFMIRRGKVDDGAMEFR